jgi:predicted RNA binding protein YcfA (HicA-like mRNA interferase family)
LHLSIIYDTFVLMKASELIKILEAKGWYFVRQRGSHKIFKHKDFKNNISVPEHGAKDLKPGTLSGILKDAGVK